MKIRTKPPVIDGYGLTVQETERLKIPLRISSEQLDKLRIDIEGYPFIAIGSALLCPKCGVQQMILSNVAPDGEVNFYLNFKCDDYKAFEEQKQAELDALASQTPTTAVETPVEASTPEQQS